MTPRAWYSQWMPKPRARLESEIREFLRQPVSRGPIMSSESLADFSRRVGREGAYRVTMLREDGPLGHVTRPTVLQLAAELSRDLSPDRIEPVGDEEVVAWTTTPEYAEVPSGWPRCSGRTSAGEDGVDATGARRHRDGRLRLK